jgi:radical SAM protein with 4Fe4S-binding SPASM domain
MCPYSIMTRSKVSMGMNLYTRIVDNAVGLGIRRLNLSVYNEPLMDRLLFERITYAKSKGMQVQFYSNGTLLSKEMNERLIESGLDKIVFSIDGATKEVYEGIRISGDFGTTASNVQNLINSEERRRSSLLVEVCCTVSPSNYHQMSTQAKKFRTLFKGADGLAIWFADARKGKSIAILSRCKSKCVYPCPRIWREMVVLSNGKVVLCCLDYDGIVELGNLTQSSIEDIWNGEITRKLRDLHLQGQAEQISLCKNCEVIRTIGASNWWRM